MTLESQDATESFLIGINSAFQDPVAIRFEFTTGDVLRGVKTRFTYQNDPKVEELSAAEAHQIRDALLAFDWNNVQDLRPEGEGVMFLDPLVITFKSRCGSVYHEAVVILSESKSIEALLYQIGILEN